MCKECDDIAKKNKEQEKIRKVFTENLPIKEGVGKNKGKQVVDWKNSISCKVKFIYKDIEGEVEIVDYKSKEQKLYIKYLDKDIYKIKTAPFIKGQLGKLLEKYTNEFKIEIGTRFIDNKRDITIINREYRKRIKNEGKIENEKWYKYKCNKCGWGEGWMIEFSLLQQGTGCSCCCNSPQVVVEGINDIPTTAPWMVKYFQGGCEEAKKYNKSSNHPIFPICPDCGRIKDKDININKIYIRKSIGCSCSDGKSYPEKLMVNILEQLNIDFETEYSPDWCEFLFNNKTRKGRYDFYFQINNKKYIIETDGELGHGNNNKISCQTKEESQFIDDEKDRLANKHEIEVIRINCIESDLDYIKNNILNSELNDLFDFNNIDWNLAEEFALSNLVMKACEIKRDNPEMSAIDIGKTMNLDRSTIKDYLKKGSKIWNWIDYNPKEESRKASIKAGKMGCKPVEIFKDGVSLGVFKSCVDLETQSEKLFGVRLSKKHISNVCTKKRKSHKGFTFKYV